MQLLIEVNNTLSDKIRRNERESYTLQSFQKNLVSIIFFGIIALLYWTSPVSFLPY